MKRKRIKEVEKGMGDILVHYDNHDVTIQDSTHSDNFSTFTKKEWERILPVLKSVLSSLHKRL